MTNYSPTVVLIEDDQYIRRFVRTGLNAHGFDVVEAVTGKAGLTAAATSKPDVIILDLGLPDMDGLGIITRLRTWTSRPVIVLSARSKESDKVAALDAGADDYLTKPFGVDELLARLRVALRHAAQLSVTNVSDVFAVRNVKVNLTKHYVERDGKEVRLTPMEYRLLSVLIKHAGRLLTQQQLLTEVWGPTYVENSNYLRIFMARLRRKLEVDPARPKVFITEPNVGYRLECD